MKAKSILFHRKKNLQFYKLPTNTNYNYPNLDFVSTRAHALQSLQVKMDPTPTLDPSSDARDSKWQSRIEQDLNEALEIPLPEDNGDL